MYGMPNTSIKNNIEDEMNRRFKVSTYMYNLSYDQVRHQQLNGSG